MKGIMIHPKETTEVKADIMVLAIMLAEVVAELVVMVEMKHPDLLIPKL